MPPPRGCPDTQDAGKNSGLCRYNPTQPWETSRAEATCSEKELLLNDLDLETVVGDKLRLLAQRGNTIVVKFEREQVERMVDALEEATADAGGRRRSRAGKGVPRSLREAGARRTTGMRLSRPAPALGG
jgi:hypothetical protein